MLLRLYQKLFFHGLCVYYRVQRSYGTSRFQRSYGTSTDQRLLQSPKVLAVAKQLCASIGARKLRRRVGGHRSSSIVEPSLFFNRRAPGLTRCLRGGWRCGLPPCPPGSRSKRTGMACASCGDRLARPGRVAAGSHACRPLASATRCRPHVTLCPRATGGWCRAAPTGARGGACWAGAAPAGCATNPPVIAEQNSLYP